MIGDRQTGENALQLWWQNSPIKLAIPFSDVKAFYDQNHPSFIENLGGAVRIADLSQDRIVTAFAQLQYDDQTKLPYFDSFFEALSGEVTTLRFEDYKQIASETISNVKTTALVGLGAYGAWIVGAAILGVVLLNIEGRRSA